MLEKTAFYDGFYKAFGFGIPVYTASTSTALLRKPRELWTKVCAGSAGIWIRCGRAWKRRV
jgi:hypothetical protein